MTAVIFDVGGVLIQWDPRHLYRRLFNGDDAAMERFLTHVCSMTWNLMQDAGRPFADGVAQLSARFPEHASLIEAFDSHWQEMVPDVIDETVEIARALHDRGVPLFALTNFSTEKFPLVRRRFDVFDLFEGIVVSGEIGVVKPDRAIYLHLLEPLWARRRRLLVHRRFTLQRAGRRGRRHGGHSLYVTGATPRRTRLPLADIAGDLDHNARDRTTCDRWPIGWERLARFRQ